MSTNCVLREERGWAGHFCASSHCRFHRNTLLTLPQTEIRLVVSTVGDYLPPHDKKVSEIGPSRYYETEVFKARFEDPYWEAKTSVDIPFTSPWSIDHFNYESDLKANDVHEVVVSEMITRLEKGEFS